MSLWNSSSGIFGYLACDQNGEMDRKNGIACEIFHRFTGLWHLMAGNPKAPRLKKFNRDWFFQSEID